MSSPVIAVLGPTASGKSALAVELARVLDGEVVCVDSRTVHRGLVIGAAAPTPEERAAVPHHLLELVEPDHFVPARELWGRAHQALVDIAGRGRTPIVAGGSRAPVLTTLFDVTWGPAEHPTWIATLPLEEVQARFTDAGVTLPLAWWDRSVLAHAWSDERITAVGERLRPTLVVRLAPDHATLRARIEARADAMVAAGLLEEVAALCDRLGVQAGALNSIGYREWAPYLEGTASVPEVVAQIVANTLAYARQQERWLDLVEADVVVDPACDPLDVVMAALEPQRAA